jgi:hypothetical protein
MKLPLWAVALALFAFTLSGCGGNTAATAPPPAPATITGHWVGSASSTVVTGTSGLNGNLVQGVTNPDGSILFSGTIFLTNSCLSTVTISGKIAGNAFALIGNNSDNSQLSFTAQLNAADTLITGNYSLVGGTICASDQGTVTLTKQ